MNSATIRRLAWLLCSLPLVWMVWAALTSNLGGNPVETLEHETGRWALNFVVLSLAVTPIRTLLGLNAIASLRRTFGLFGFAYAFLHVLIYAVLDRGLLWSELLIDLTKRPYIILGTLAFLIALVLAATSPKFAVRKLGGLRWRRVHRLAYCLGPVAVAHFLWLKSGKNLWEQPALYAAVVAALLIWRVFHWLNKSRELSSQSRPSSA